MAFPCTRWTQARWMSIFLLGCSVLLIPVEGQANEPASISMCGRTFTPSEVEYNRNLPKRSWIQPAFVGMAYCGTPTAEGYCQNYAPCLGPGSLAEKQQMRQSASPNQQTPAVDNNNNSDDRCGVLVFGCPRGYDLVTPYGQLSHGLSWCNGEQQTNSYTCTLHVYTQTYRATVTAQRAAAAAAAAASRVNGRAPAEQPDARTSSSSVNAATLAAPTATPSTTGDSPAWRSRMANPNFYKQLYGYDGNAQPSAPPTRR